MVQNMKLLGKPHEIHFEKRRIKIKISLIRVLLREDQASRHLKGIP